MPENLTANPDSPFDPLEALDLILDSALKYGTPEQRLTAESLCAQFLIAQARSRNQIVE